MATVAQKKASNRRHCLKSCMNVTSKVQCQTPLRECIIKSQGEISLLGSSVEYVRCCQQCTRINIQRVNMEEK